MPVSFLLKFRSL